MVSRARMDKDDHFRIKKIPLLIGGATCLARTHRREDCAQLRRPVVSHCPMRRAAWAWRKACWARGKAAYLAEVAADYEHVRELHAKRKAPPHGRLTRRAPMPPQLDLPPAHRAEVRWAGACSKLRPGRNRPSTSDWGPFFQTWDGRAPPAILDDEMVGVEARKVWRRRPGHAEEIIEGRWLTANGVMGLFPANRVGDDIEFYTDATRTEVLMTWYGLRQQTEKQAVDAGWPGRMRPSRRLGRLPRAKGRAATTPGCLPSPRGIGSREEGKKTRSTTTAPSCSGAPANRPAEAFAECLHERVRMWGWRDRALNSEDLIRENTRAPRPRPSPACPDHGEIALFRTLNTDENRHTADRAWPCSRRPASAASTTCTGLPTSRPARSAAKVQDMAARRGAGRWTNCAGAWRQTSASVCNPGVASALLRRPAWRASGAVAPLVARRRTGPGRFAQRKYRVSGGARRYLLPGRPAHKAGADAQLTCAGTAMRRAARLLAYASAMWPVRSWQRQVETPRRRCAASRPSLHDASWQQATNSCTARSRPWGVGNALIFLKSRCRW